MKNKRRKNKKNSLNQFGNNDKSRVVKRKKLNEKTQNKENSSKKLEVSFYSYKNLYLKDIHNFIVNLRIKKSIFKNELFVIKNNENLNNLIICLVPNLSNWYIKDITTNNVFKKLQKNNNFRKVHKEKCVKNNCSNLILKTLSVSVSSNKKKNKCNAHFNIENYLLTKEQLLLNKYPNNNSHDYINFDNIKYVKRDKHNISDIKEYLSVTMNSTYIMNDPYLHVQKHEKMEGNFLETEKENKQFGNKQVENVHSENINAETILAEYVEAKNEPLEKDKKEEFLTDEQIDQEQKNTFTIEHINMYADALQKLLKASTNWKKIHTTNKKPLVKTELVHVPIQINEENEKKENNELNGNSNLFTLSPVLYHKWSKIGNEKEYDDGVDLCNHLKVGQMDTSTLLNGSLGLLGTHEKSRNSVKSEMGKESSINNEIGKGSDVNNDVGEEKCLSSEMCKESSVSSEHNGGEEKEEEIPFGDFDLNNIFSIDCEMCETTNHQRELTKITVVDAYMNIVYDSYVVPDNKITNYLTLYSGINESTLENVNTKLKDVQEYLKKILNNKSILIGHSLENDLHALKIKHDYVIDTSVIYSGSNYYFIKPSLFNLSKKHLNITMKRDNGHNSIDDAKISMFLAIKKISEFGANEFSSFYHPLPLFLNRDNYSNIANNIIQEEDICFKYEKNLCIYDSKNKYIEEKVPKIFLKNCFHCVCENDDECAENLIMNLKNKNKIKNYILIFRDYENLCNEKMYNCFKNANNENFKIENNEKMFEFPSRVEANEILNKLSSNIEKIYNNMGKNDALILLSFNDNYLAEEKIKETLCTAKDIFYSAKDINEKLNNVDQKIKSLEEFINRKKKDNVWTKIHFFEFQHLLYTYDKCILNYLNENRTNEKNMFIINSLRTLRNTLCVNDKKRNFNGWFSILLKS
ncbi:exoribonuclease, putative [Plasmodium malariae]|uniref:Exoribonuclease, putative n=1 Tax=Plasmodium malariae TaxID=5858 RepID=A0A1D3SP68_PLAMA|nr:exoribonuclease, putative [Plasmodium malariae]SCO93681.1 exoribonuclease, putative [Plasmodium malariae]